MVYLYKIVGGDLIDLTPVVGNIARRSASGEVSEEISFDIAKEDSLSNAIIKEGEVVLLKSDTETLFKGIVVARTNIGISNVSLKAFDFGWYLNKNEDIYQFNGTVSSNIKRILDDYAIPIGGIVNISTEYKTVNRGSLSSIISKMLELAEKEQGKKYRWEFRQDKFYLEELDYNIVDYKTSLATGKEESSNKYLGNVSSSSSIEDRFNAIKVVGEEKNSIKQLAYQEDTGSISKIGKLQKLEYLSNDDYSKAPSIAINQLNDLNKDNKTIRVALLGDNRCRANRIISIVDDIHDISGSYKIKQCVHKYNKIHVMELELMTY